MKKLNYILIQEKSKILYKIDVIDDLNIEMEFINIDDNTIFRNKFTYNYLKINLPFVHLSLTIYQIIEKIEKKFQSKQYEINIQNDYIFINFFFTIDNEFCNSNLKLFKSKNIKLNNINDSISLNNSTDFLEIKPLNLNFKKAEEKDISIILNFIKELADYEKSLDKVIITEDELKEYLLSNKKYVEAQIVYYEGNPIGFFLYFFNFSTWAGKGLYLEDLYLKPEFRGIGIGKNILAYLAKFAIENDCKRFEWIVLDWNEPSINLYKRVGAIPMDDWTIYRLTGNNLDNLASLNKIL